MINWFNMPDEGLSNGGLFEVKELEVTENGTYETKGEMYNKVTVNVEGGGGSSDLAVYKVNIVNNTSTNINGIQAYYGVGLNANGEPTEIINVDIRVLANKNNELGILVFLKAEEPFGVIRFGSSVNATCTGGVAPMEGMEGQFFIVTGDGTITIS